MSVLPLPYATMLGYATGELEYTTIDQVEGSADAWVPKLPCSASVAGGPIDSFDLKPVFINALDALWGRADFLSAFQLELNEPAQSFTIRRY